MNTLLHHLIAGSARRSPAATALVAGSQAIPYEDLHDRVRRFASALVADGVERGARVGIYLEKRFEAVVASFGAAAAGCVFVPVNPLLKPDQVAHILRDCNVCVLVTTAERLEVVREALSACADLRTVVRLGAPVNPPSSPAPREVAWSDYVAAPTRDGHRVIDTDIAAILYTSGSTGRPKGVVLSHRNLVAGAQSVAEYLGNHEEDVLLSVLPLSFDAGFSQLTTAFHAGARVVLLDYLLPKDVLTSLAANAVTGLTAVPPLWIQLARLEWPAGIADHLRYIANTGGRMPLETLTALRARLPRTRPYLMYGLTEAFRSTYLPPEEADRRPDSIGKAIPNAEILVLRDDGTPCAPGEPGELVHRGALVALGYWNDVAKTAERFKPLPPRASGLVLPEIAVYSGDTVRADEEGFLYFVGRRDEMIKTSGYRVSPTELEELLYSTRAVGEAIAFGVPHPVLGEAIVCVATRARGATVDGNHLLAECRSRLPAFMVPAKIELRDGSLPRNPNGKIDRKLVRAEFLRLFEDAAP